MSIGQRHVGLLIKLLAVLFVHQLAVAAAVVPTLVIESVADFVADYGTDAAVVYCVSAFISKNGGCKIPAGKTISVSGWAVVSVYRSVASCPNGCDLLLA